MYRAAKARIISNKLLTAYTVVVAALLLFFSFFDTTYAADTASNSLVYKAISYVIPSSGIVSEIVAFVLNLLTAAAVYFANRHYMFIRRETMFPVFFVILFGGMHKYGLNADLYCQLLVLVAIVRFLDSYNRRNTAWNVAGVMLCMSTASLISPSYIWYIFIFYIGFIIYNNFSWRDFFASLFGIAMPILLALQVLVLMDKPELLVNYYSSMFNAAAVREPGTWGIAIAIAGFVPAAISFIEFIIHYSSDKTHQRKSMLFLYMFLGLVVGMFYIYPFSISMQTSTYAMLTAICTSHFFATNNTRFAKWCFYVFTTLLLLLRGLEVFL